MFQYSGHGSQVPDRDGDETDDGLDEIICPYDLDWNDPFTDDNLFAIVKNLPESVNLTVVLDCCHSGTGLREFTGTTRTPRCRCIHPPMAVPGPRQAEPALKRFGARAAECGAILVAGCRSDQVSADAYIDGDYHGALTCYLCRALEKLKFAGSYREVVNCVRRPLREDGNDQAPQLEGPSALLDGPVLASRLELAAE